MINKNRVIALLSATALSVVAVQPANAQSVEELKAQLAALAKRIDDLEKKQDKKAPVVKKSEPAFALGTKDGLFEFNVRGRIYADAGWGSDDDGTMDYDATEFRTARLGIEGKAWKNVKYKFEADFADNEVDLKDVYLQYKSEVGSWKFGQFKTPNSLEEQTSSRHTTFMERSSFTDAFGLARMLGVGYGNGGDNWTFNAGVFRGSAGSDSADEGETFAARVTYGNKMDNGAWMLGASTRFRNVGDQDLLRYRQRPHNHLSDRFVATSRISEKDTMFGLELAGQMGSFHVASEFASLSANDGGSQGRDATFSGGYIEAGWFITGESKPLKLSKGTWDRPKVKNPMNKGGMGAWQLAAKFDYIDLTDNGVFGGEQETFILGANWYLNRHSRFMVNYSHSSIKEAFDVEANGADGENGVDTLGVRFQVDW
jgi:phosphate-selective porin OprO/OprP